MVPIAQRNSAADISEENPRLRVVNEALARAWGKGWFSKPQLEPQALIRAARQTSGLADFGDNDGWRDRLDRLTCALDQEADLTPLGTTIAYGQLVAALAGRARAEAMWRRYPGIADVPLVAPIIIVGQMRSGSTRMQRLLACDNRLAFTRFYESWNPVPRWNWSPLDDRRMRGWLALRIARWLNPRFNVIHPVRSRQADEEIGLHNLGLYGAAFEAQWRIPSFARHAEHLDSRPIYAEFRRHLQTIKWLRRDKRDRPWILKLPQFSQDLEAVLHAFPDARLVVLDRDPVQVVGSSASLVRNQMAVQSRKVDAGWIGDEWLHKVSLRQRRTAQARAAHDRPSVDVAFGAMREDWRGQMRRVYRTLDLSFDAHTERAMARFMDKRSHRKLGRHRYDIADFGLTEARITAAMASPVEAELAA